jgi:23S rRNA (guanosine2251-2'-O)-methyltransferase
VPITVRNPHSVLAALKKRPRDVTQLTIPRAARGAGADDVWTQVIRLAEQNRVPITAGGGGGNPRARGPAPVQGPSDGREGGAGEAILKDHPSLAAEELFQDARERGGGRGLWLALDQLQDPHNVGAIFRAAAFFGVQGIVLTSERSAPLSGTVYDVACGGVEDVPFTMQTNLQQAFDIAKEAGCWILGASEHAQDDVGTVASDRPWLLVLGNEEKGMRRLTEESCDVLCKISQKGRGVSSLNVSVAAGILISKLTALSE